MDHICPVCGGYSRFLGIWGHKNWLRCVYCGLEFSVEPGPDDWRENAPDARAPEGEGENDYSF
jgi:rubredoxin